MKPISNVWEHFIAFDENQNVLSGSGVVKAKTVLCKQCQWQRAPNQTRMKTHVEQCHQQQDVETPEERLAPRESEEAPKPVKRQLTLDHFTDRKFSEGEQREAEMAQV
jgi:hypothetical protein